LRRDVRFDNPTAWTDDLRATISARQELGSGEEGVQHDRPSDLDAVAGTCPVRAGVVRLRNLTKTPARRESGPVWSPDGQHIAFTVHEPGWWASDVFIMDADGANRRNLTADNPLWDGEPAWFDAKARAVSPLGKQATTWGWIRAARARAERDDTLEK
jgi:catechol 2,3-dioxygenase-like lactoylglutathione lyase family enzyme